MKREEILEKSRKTKQDEGMVFAGNRGRVIGISAFVVLCAFYFIFTTINGDSDTFRAVSSVFWIYIAGESFGKYRFTKQKVYLLTMMAGGLASLLYTVLFIIQTVG
ncbi:MAG: DUF6442 family protein [Clostridiales bacterium]|nr:DUF6442 family protein [Clostridiales bacterium]